MCNTNVYYGVWIINRASGNGYSSSSCYTNRLGSLLYDSEGVTATTLDALQNSLYEKAGSAQKIQMVSGGMSVYKAAKI